MLPNRQPQSPGTAPLRATCAGTGLPSPSSHQLIIRHSGSEGRGGTPASGWFVLPGMRSAGAKIAQAAPDSSYPSWRAPSIPFGKNGPHGARRCEKCFTAVWHGNPGALNILSVSPKAECFVLPCSPAELGKSHPQRLSAFPALQVTKLLHKTWLVHTLP